MFVRAFRANQQEGYRARQCNSIISSSITNATPRTLANVGVDGSKGKGGNTRFAALLDRVCNGVEERALPRRGFPHKTDSVAPAAAAPYIMKRPALCIHARRLGRRLLEVGGEGIKAGGLGENGVVQGNDVMCTLAIRAVWSTLSSSSLPSIAALRLGSEGTGTAADLPGAPGPTLGGFPEPDKSSLPAASWSAASDSHSLAASTSWNAISAPILLAEGGRERGGKLETRARAGRAPGGYSPKKQGAGGAPVPQTHFSSMQASMTSAASFLSSRASSSEMDSAPERLPKVTCGRAGR